MPDENEAYHSKEEQAFTKRRYFYRIGPVLLVLVAFAAAGLTQLFRVFWIGAYAALQSWHIGLFKRTCSQVAACRDMPGVLMIPEWMFAGLLFLELFALGLLISTILPLLGIILRRAPLWIMLTIFFLANAASISMGVLMYGIPLHSDLRSFAQDWTAMIVLGFIALRFAESIVRSMTELAWMLFCDFFIVLGCGIWGTWIFRGLSNPPEPMPILLTTMLLMIPAEFVFQYALYRSGKSRF